MRTHARGPSSCASAKQNCSHAPMRKSGARRPHLSAYLNTNIGPIHPALLLIRNNWPRSNPVNVTRVRLADSPERTRAANVSRRCERAI